MNAMKYVVGYSDGNCFVILYEYEGIHVALAMARALKAAGKKNVEIKKKVLTSSR